jgi:META domain
MISVKSAFRVIAFASLSFLSLPDIDRATAAEGFPFGMEMTLDAARLPGSKRVPDLDIGEHGEVVLELWCKGGKGQFSVAGNTVIFVAGQIEDRTCPANKAQLDDDLVAALSEATTWKRQGDYVSFIGSRTLRFRINTN